MFVVVLFLRGWNMNKNPSGISNSYLWNQRKVCLWRRPTFYVKYIVPFWRLSEVIVVRHWWFVSRLRRLYALLSTVAMLSKLHIFGERRQLGLLPKQRQKGRQIQAYLSFFPFVEIQPEFLKCDQYEGSLLAVRKKTKKQSNKFPSSVVPYRAV